MLTVFSLDGAPAVYVYLGIHLRDVHSQVGAENLNQHLEVLANISGLDEHDVSERLWLRVLNFFAWLVNVRARSSGF